MEATEGQGQRGERAMNETSGPLSWAHPATMLRAEGAVLLAGGAASYWLNGAHRLLMSATHEWR